MFTASWAVDQEAVGGKTPPAVVEALSKGEPQDIIVLLDDSAIQAEADQMKSAIGAKTETPEVLSFKSSEYDSLKNEVMAALPLEEFEVKKDYSHLPMFFLTVNTSGCLSTLLADERVVRVYENKACRHFLNESLPLINQPDAEANGNVGTGTTAAVLDTGLDERPLVAAQLPQDIVRM